MSAEVFANQPQTQVTSGGTTAPSAGTQESWTPLSPSGFPPASPVATPPTFFRVTDPAAPSEKVIVTDSRTVPWTVTRGAEGTQPVAHQAGFSVVQVVTAATLGSFLQSSQAAGEYLAMPSGTPTAGYVPEVIANGSPATVWTAPSGGGGAVSSVFGRAGAVAASSGDYAVGQVTGAAPLASPALTGTPTAPTQSPGDSSTKIATDAFVATAVAAEMTRAEAAEALLAPLISPSFTGTVTVPSPASSSAAVPKSYADAIAQGLSVKPSVQEATAAALPSNTYANGASGVGATLTATANAALAVDGIAVSVNDRVLVQNEATPSHNGIYTVTAAGSAGSAYVLTRVGDMNTAAQVPGAFAFVEEGTVNAGAGFTVASPGPFTIGTTAITWTQFSGAGEITAGTGLAKSGNAISLAPDSTTGDIQPSPGTASAGISGLAPRVDHVHGQPPVLAPTGKTGAVAATSYAGGTTSGPPVTGTYAVGDWVQAQDGPIWLCTTAGTPGQWRQAGDQPWQFRPETYGAKRDGQAVMDGAMGSGGSTVTCATSAPFKASDVGKVITVEAAGAQLAGTSTPSAGSGTITSFISAAQVGVSFTASGNISGRTVIWGTDDTAALNASIAAGALYAAANRYFFEWLLSVGIYMAAGPLIQGGASKTNSQIPLPVVPISSNPTMVMRITGTRCNSGPMMFGAGGDTPMAPVEGTVICSTLTGQAYSGTYGQPAVIGGPTFEQGYTGANSNLWNNLMVVVDGLTVLVPPITSLSGIDLTSCNKSETPWARSMAAAPAPVLAGGNYNPVWQGGQSYPKGLVLPQGGNNAHVTVGSFTSYGFATGCIASEHATIHELVCILNGVGLSCNGVGGQHDISVLTFTAEANNTHLTATNADDIGVNIVSMSCENVSQWQSGYHIDDAAGHLFGRIGISTSQSVASITTNGAANLEVILGSAGGAGQQAHGVVGPPGVPLTTVALRNPYWRHATVYITSGGAAVSAIAVNGTATGLTLSTTGTVTARVPSGATITLTYASTAPTWKWVLD